MVWQGPVLDTPDLCTCWLIQSKKTFIYTCNDSFIIQILLLNPLFSFLLRIPLKEVQFNFWGILDFQILFQIARASRAN